MTPSSITDIFERLLVPMWLRPERALWEAHSLHAVQQLLEGYDEGPGLEWGCTDGILTFVLCGGRFAVEFDNYDEVDPDISGDIDAPLGKDYFGKAETGRAVEARVEWRPSSCFDVGVSWKEAHIAQASRLEIFQELRCQPLDQPFKDFPDGHFATIFAHNLFWLETDRLQPALREMRRLLRKGGRLIAIFPDERQKDFLFYPKMKEANAEWALRIDRGIALNNSRHARSEVEWRRQFEQCGLRVVRRVGYIPPVVSLVYQIGLRPLFPALIRMYHLIRAADPSNLIDLKRYWIEVVRHHMAPLADTGWMDESRFPRLWHAFHLES